MATSQESPGNGGGQRRGTSARPREEIDKLKQKASQALDEAKTQGKDKLESGKDAAAETADRLANAVERAVGEFGQDTSFAGYANQLAQGMHSLAENLRNRNVNELLDEAQSLARRNPAVFLVGSVAVGLALARFLKASSERQMSESYETSDRTSGEYYSGSAAGYGSSTGASGSTSVSGYGGTSGSTTGGSGGTSGGYGGGTGSSGYGGSAGSTGTSGGTSGSSGASGYGGTSGSGSTSGYGGDVPTVPGADRGSGGPYRGG